MSGRILTGRMLFVYRKPLSQNTFHKKPWPGWARAWAWI